LEADIRDTRERRAWCAAVGTLDLLDSRRETIVDAVRLRAVWVGAPPNGC
jgi:hypothetical protein